MHITPKDSSSCKHAATSIKAPHCHQRQNKPTFCSSLHSTAPSSAQIDKLCYFWTCLRMICFAQTMVTLLFFTSGFWRDCSSRSGTGVLLFNFLYHSWVRTLMSVQMKAFALRILFWSNVLLSTKPCLHILCCTKHLNVMASGWRNFPVSLFWRTCGFSLFIFFCLILTLYVKRWKGLSR